jgi:hypothetical protein
MTYGNSSQQPLSKLFFFEHFLHFEPLLVYFLMILKATRLLILDFLKYMYIFHFIRNFRFCTYIRLFLNLKLIKLAFVIFHYLPFLMILLKILLFVLKFKCGGQIHISRLRF